MEGFGCSVGKVFFFIKADYGNFFGNSAFGQIIYSC